MSYAAPGRMDLRLGVMVMCSPSAVVRGGVDVGRDRVARLMGSLGLVGVSRTRRVRTTIAAPLVQRPADLVERVFSAPAGAGPLGPPTSVSRYAGPSLVNASGARVGNSPCGFVDRLVIASPIGMVARTAPSPAGEAIRWQ